MPFKQFDRSKLKLKPLRERVHDLTLECLVRPDSPYQRCEHEALPILADRVRRARDKGSSVIFML